MLLTPLGHRIVVRFARKAFWKPTAPSKLFRITEHKFYSKEEVERIHVLHKAYIAQEAAIREFARVEFYEPAQQTGGIPMEFQGQDQKLYEQFLAENDAENERIRQLREEYFESELKKTEELLLEEKYKMETQLYKTAEFVDEYVRQQKADEFSIVTPDNIDAILEQAIQNPVNPEFCIDAQGRKYTGSSMKPEDTPKEAVAANKS